MKIDMNTVTPKTRMREIEDGGTIRMGAVSPSFPPARTTPADVKDREHVRLGAVSPSFPPAR